MNKFKIFGIEVDSREIGLFIFIGLFFIFGPKLLTLILGYNDFNKTGQIGDTFGGLTAPFLSYFGSVLVYLAFKAQIDANNKITQQFDEQNTDQLFFRVFDNFKELRSDLKFIDWEADHYIGQDAIKQLAIDCTKYLNKEKLIDLSIFIIENHFEVIDSKLIHVIAEKINGIPFYDTKEKNADFTNTLKNTPSGERIGFILGKYQLEQPKNTDSLNNYYQIQNTSVDSSFYQLIYQIGSKYFYNYDFEHRLPIYKATFHSYKKRNKEHLDRLLNTIEYLFKIIGQSKNKKFYFDYLFYNMVESEKFILFSTLLSTDLDPSFKKDLVAFFNQFDVHFSSEYFYDNPSETIVKNEINSILQSI
jgi:hypothetical protein